MQVGAELNRKESRNAGNPADSMGMLKWMNWVVRQSLVATTGNGKALGKDWSHGKGKKQPQTFLQRGLQVRRKARGFQERLSQEKLVATGGGEEKYGCLYVKRKAIKQMIRMNSARRTGLGKGPCRRQGLTANTKWKRGDAKPISPLSKNTVSERARQANTSGGARRGNQEQSEHHISSLVRRHDDLSPKMSFQPLSRKTRLGSTKEKHST